MQFARVSHSSCVLGSYIYVIGGGGEFNHDLNSIERLYLKQELAEVKSEIWFLFKFHTNVFPPRFSLVSCALNETEIMIAGGLYEDTNKQF